MLFFGDMMYVWMVLLPGLLLSGGASMLVKAAFSRYSQVGTRRGLTGAQAAQLLLDRAGIHDVQIVPVPGHLSDHYNPVTKQLALSEPVYGSNSVAAVGVATHEAGHAIQHAVGYIPLKLRSIAVPAVGIGGRLGPIVLFAGLMMLAAGIAFGKIVTLVGAVLFSLVLLFQLITLPVEFDASFRARRLVVEAGIVGTDERAGIDRVLTAAALTYVAAAISTALTLLYFLIRSGLLGGSDD